MGECNKKQCLYYAFPSEQYLEVVYKDGGLLAQLILLQGEKEQDQKITVQKTYFTRPTPYPHKQTNKQTLNKPYTRSPSRHRKNEME